MQQPAVFAEKADRDEPTRTLRNFHYWSKENILHTGSPKGSLPQGQAGWQERGLLKNNPSRHLV